VVVGRRFRIVAVLLVVAALMGILVVLNRPKATNMRIVGVIEPMEHVAISDITRGIKEGLANHSGLEVRVANAAGDATTMAQIIERYKDNGVAIYVPIFTKTAQAVKSSISGKPIIFAAVTDPASAG